MGTQQLAWGHNAFAGAFGDDWDEHGDLHPRVPRDYDFPPMRPAKVRPDALTTPITLCYLGLCAPILRSRASRGATLLPPSTLVDTFFYLDRHRRRPPPPRNTPRRLARRPTGIAFAVNSECVYFEMDPVNDRRGSQDSTLAATTCSSPSAVVSHRPPPFRHIQVPLPL